MNKIEGSYNFKIWKDGDWYLAQDKKRGVITQGKSKEEVFMMIADAYLTIHEVKISWWSRFIHKLFRIL